MSKWKIESLEEKWLAQQETNEMFEARLGNTLTYPTLGKGKSSSKSTLGGDMLVPEGQRGNTINGVLVELC